jgi:hypothetical protein
MPAFELAALAHLSVELLKNHWELAVAPVADALLWETGKSLFALFRERFAGRPAGLALEDAAGDPTNQRKADSLEQEVRTAVESDSELAGAVGELLRSLPPQTLMRIAQTGDKNVSVQNVGESNKTSIQIS